MPRSTPKPNCYIVAGSNGAGKTTFATEFLPRYAECTNFINPDLIARGLSPFDPNAAMLRAGRVVLERIHESMRGKTDFAFETTLSGRAYASLIKELRRAGYRVHMFYIWVPSPDLALVRIRDRVTKGGHDVPALDVRRRFTRTLTNLFTLYRPLLDSLHFFDNSRAELHLIFKDEAGQTTVFDAQAYEELLSRVRS
jgi:predicted ABC-type ATPase